jgi:ureidoglycolate dehydrogenase (NAD+)
VASNTKQRHRFGRDDLAKFTQAVLSETGIDDDDAAIVADVLVQANVRGVDSHGVIRLPAYVENVEEGGFNPDPDAQLQQLNTSAFAIDADGGFGHPMMMDAVDESIRLAKKYGSSVGVVRNSNHIGMMAYYTKRAADENCITLASTNVPPQVAPFGGADPYFGTNPIAYSVPSTNDFHITLDMATSVVAHGKVLEAEKEGKDIPEGWAITEAGAPATSPENVNAFLPFGGPKGYGLSLFVDICSGLLSGVGPSPQTNFLHSEPSTPMNLGHFLFTIDIESFTDSANFRSQVSSLITDLKSISTQPDIDEVHLPGELEYKTQLERESKGVPLPQGVIDTLSPLSDQFGVPFPDEL